MPKRRPTPGGPVVAPPRGAIARRERILSVTLELIGELGVEAITMRDLALRCDVAVATLYNQFGSRESVIAEALRGDILGRYQPVVKRTNALDPAAKLRERVATTARGMTGPWRGYTRSMMIFYFQPTADSHLRAVIHDFVAADFEVIVREIGALGDLQPWVRPDVFADDLVTQLCSLVMKWTQGHISDRALKSRLMRAAATSFCGITTGESRTAFEALAAASA